MNDSNNDYENSGIFQVAGRNQKIFRESETFFFLITYISDKKLQFKKLTEENKIIQLVKPKTKHHPTLISEKYAYGEMLHIIADISNTTLKYKIIEIKIKIKD